MSAWLKCDICELTEPKHVMRSDIDHRFTNGDYVEDFDMPRAESEFEGQCVKDLRELGYLVYTHADSRRNVKNKRSDSGYPDITFAGHGRVGFIECKMPKNKRGDVDLDEGQIEWQDAIEWARHESAAFHGKDIALRHWVATPENWQEILQELA